MDKQKNIPKLRFPQFKDEWFAYKMGEIFTFKVTNSFSRDNLNYEEGTVKNIHYGDIHTKFQTLFDITKESVPFINPDISIERISKDNYCQVGDFILADASEDLNDVGKCIELIYLNDEKLLSGLHTILARPKPKTLFLGFGGYLLKSINVRCQIQKEAQGSKITSISATRLSNISLNIPSKEEQQKIASFLSAIDERLQVLKKKKSLLVQYKKGVMQKIFLQELRFKDENGNQFPEWETKKLGKVCEIKKGKQLNKEELTEKGLYPCLNGGINFSGYTEKFNSNENTITISEGGNSCGYINFMTTKFWLGGHCYKIIIINEINQKYFFQLLKFYEPKIMNLRVGSGLPNIQQKDLRNFEFAICNCLAEQTKIANFLSAIDDKISLVAKALETTQQYKKGLLQQMFV